MVEKSIYDLILDELIDRQHLVKDELRERFKRTAPFRQKPVSPKEQLVQFSELTDEDIRLMRIEYGDEAINNYLADIDKIARRYQR